MASSSINGITISGLASGIDTDSLITKMMTLERQPETILQNKSDDYTAMNTVISSINSKLSALSTIVEQFMDPSMPFFSQSRATSTVPTVAQGVVNGSQPPQGIYQITVSQVATAAMKNSGALYTGSDLTAQPASLQSSAGLNASGQTLDPTQSLASQAGNLATPAGASGSITINGTSFAWDNTMSLNTILGNINNAGLGVTAKYNAGTQRVSLTSDITGSTGSIALSESGGNLLSVLNLSAGTVTGTDAAPTNANAALSSASAHLDRAATSGTFTVNGVVFSVDANTDTLNSVLSRINNSSAGVTATFNVNSEQITLTQKSVGSSATIVLGAAGDTSNILYALKLSENNPPTGGAGDSYAGTDTKISLNGGAEQTLGSNSITSLVPGVTINVQGVGTTQLTVGADVDSMVETVKNFVSQYNDIMDFINTKTREERVDSPTTAEERIQGKFMGNMEFLDTKYKLSSIISTVVSGLPDTMNQMAQLGITTSGDNFGKDATLVLDETKLRAALSSDPGAVDAVFNTSGTGVMSQMKTQLHALTNYVDGTFTDEQKYYETQISSIKESITAFEDRMVQREAQLRQQFASMESMIATLKSQGERISQMMSSSSG